MPEEGDIFVGYIINNNRIEFQIKENRDKNYNKIPKEYILFRKMILNHYYWTFKKNLGSFDSPISILNVSKDNFNQS